MKFTPVDATLLMYHLAYKHMWQFVNDTDVNKQIARGINTTLDGVDLTKVTANDMPPLGDWLVEHADFMFDESTSEYMDLAEAIRAIASNTAEIPEHYDFTNPKDGDLIRNENAQEFVFLRGEWHELLVADVPPVDVPGRFVKVN